MLFFGVVQAIALDFASRRRACKLIPSQTASARSSMDRASDYGSEGWGFESLRARSGPPRCDPPVGVLHFYQALLRECFFHAHPLVVVPASRFSVRSEVTSAQQRAYLSGGATGLAQHSPFRGCSAKKLRPAQPLLRCFRARTHHVTEQGELFRAQGAARGNCETAITSASEKRAQNAYFSPAKAMAVSDNRAAWSAEPDHSARGRWLGQSTASVGNIRYKRRQTDAIQIASRGPLLQTSSIQAQKPAFSAKKPLN